MARCYALEFRAACSRRAVVPPLRDEGGSRRRWRCDILFSPRRIV